MIRIVASVALVVVLGACGGAEPEEKPAAPKAEAGTQVQGKEGTAAKKAVADAKKEVEAKAVPVEPPAVEPAAGAAAAVAAGAAATPVLEVFEAEDGRAGYRTAAGEVVIPAKYGVAMPFVDAVAGVAADEGWIFIDRTGKKLAAAFVFDNAADDFVEGRARIVEGEKHGFLASTGEVVVPPTWSFVEAFSGGYAAVCEGCKREQVGEHYSMVGGTWGYVDTKGTLVIPPRFSQAGPFVDGRATVSEGGRELVIGPDGVELK